MTVRIKRFETPDERRNFELGRFELLELAGVSLGRAIYQPGWKWSEHVGARTGEAWCEVEHVGWVLSGRAAVRMRDGAEYELKAGDLFYVPPGHDSWVVGDEPYSSLHLQGSEHYARADSPGEG